MPGQRSVGLKVGGIFAAALLMSQVPAASRSADRRAGSGTPNCLIITVDTWRADRLSASGSKTVRTPAMDGLAGTGVLFSRAFAHTVMTLPSHANILLGAAPPYHGVHDNANFVVPEGIPSLAEIFKAEGYATAAFIGAYPLDRRFGLDRGFDVYDDDYGAQDFGRREFVERPAADVVGRASAWLRDRTRPWFLWIHCFDPHAPYVAPEPFAAEYAGSPYDGEVAYVDRTLGGLFADLRTSGAFEHTMIVLTGDHGESLGEHGEATHGCYAYDPTLRVPLIIAAPGIAPGRTDAVVSHVDIFPTLCDLAGVRKPVHLQGRSLVPALRGRRLAERPVYFESLYPYYSRGWAPLRGVIEFPKKFIETPIPELYDLEADPAEARNLIAGTDHDARRKKLEALVKSLSSPAGAVGTARAPTVASMEKLRSLGYVAGAAPASSKDFGPGDDVKSFMVFEARAAEALDIFRERGDAAAAADILTANIRDKKDHDLSYTTLAELHRRLGRPAEAAAVLKRGLANVPGNYTILLAYVSVLLDLGGHREVVDILDSAAWPQTEADPEIWNARGAAYAGLGEFGRAIDDYRKAIALDADFPAALTNMGTAFLMRARASGERGDIGSAMDAFKRAIAVDPGHAAAYNGLGAAYRTAGDREAAIACWREALARDPNLDFAWYNLGSALLDKGENDRALECLLKYKERVYDRLPPGEKAALDELIRRAGRGTFSAGTAG